MTRQHELPDDFKRFWRISLTGKGYHDEYVEVLGYTPEDMLRIRYLRDNMIEEAPPLAVFPISDALHDELAGQYVPYAQLIQPDLFQDVEMKRGDTSANATSATPTTFTTI